MMICPFGLCTLPTAPEILGLYERIAMNTEEARKVFTTLEAGDRIRYRRPERPVYFMMVLEVADDGAFSLSEPSTLDIPPCVPWAHYNPFHWDETKRVVVQSSGHEAVWYQYVVAVDRRAQLVPLVRSLAFQKKVIDAFMASDLKRFVAIMRLARDVNECTSDAEQVAQLLRIMNVPVTNDVVAAITCWHHLRASKGPFLEE